MTVVLYWMSISHPSQVARKMLDLKGVEYEVVDVVPLNQRIHLRLAGFRGGTVPALKLDGRRIQGSRQIARALDERWPEPPLFPAEPGLRARVEEAERWGEEQLQPIPRRLFRYAFARDPELLDHVDRLLGDGTLTLDPPNAATLQIMATVNVMTRFADLAELVAAHACAAPARELFPNYRGELPPFLDRAWLEPTRSAP